MGGGSAARDAAHSTSSAYSDGGSLQKKSMGKSKKCALTVKQVSVTTWSLTIGDFFFVFSFFFSHFSHQKTFTGIQDLQKNNIFYR